MVTYGYSDRKDSHLKRLRRVEGQVRGLQRMVEEDKYCIDILTQVSAATKALQSFSLELLEEHLVALRRRGRPARRPGGRGEGPRGLRGHRPPRPQLTPRDTPDHEQRSNRMTSTTTYDVIGMTCAHCVQAVTDEVSAIAGVRDVDIDLVAGGTSAVRVVSDEPLAVDVVRDAVDEAGYELVGTP